jgi:hypothetical protein
MTAAEEGPVHVSPDHAATAGPPFTGSRVDR